MSVLAVTEPNKADAHVGAPVGGLLRRSPSSPRRVLYAIDQLQQLGGAERMLFETVKKLDRARFEPSIVTFDLSCDLPGLDRLPAKVHFIPLRKTYDWQAIKAAVSLRRLLQGEKVEILHCFFETSDLWAAPIAKICGCPVIISSRRDMGILRRRKHSLAYPIVNRVFDKVLSVSDQVRNFAIEQEKLPGAKIETLYNGIDIAETDSLAQAYEARRSFSIPQGSPVVTLVANVRRVKGIDVLVRAAAILVAHLPQIRFVIAGKVLEEATMKDLFRLISDLKLDNNFLFLGAIENPHPLLAESDVFVLPSRNEGFSNALIEAMAAGLPCIATRVGGNAEALQEGVNGFLIDSEDHETLAERLLQVLRDPQAARRMGRRARETAVERFSMSAMVDRLMDIYDELVENRLAH
jgi:glycosyltransferase involved in cell wall biosynthesis